MELNKAAGAVQPRLVTVWQAANEFMYDKFYLNMPAKMLSNLKLKVCISEMKYKNATPAASQIMICLKVSVKTIQHALRDLLNNWIIINVVLQFFII